MESEPLDSGRALSEARKLHPSSLVFRFFGFLRPFAIPIVLALFFTSSDTREIWIAVGIGPLMLFEVARYFSFRYRFTEEGIVLRNGIVFRNERVVPYARVQNIETRQGFFHRLIGVVDVRVETASGSEAEAKLTVVSSERLEELRRFVYARGSSALQEQTEATQSVSSGRMIYRLGSFDAVLLGSSPLRGLAIVGVGLGFLWELNLFERLPPSLDWGRVVGETSWAIGALLVVASVLVLFALSIFATLLRLHDFRVERHEQSFRVQCGLLTHHYSNLEAARIQSVTISRPFLLRRFGRASIKLSTAAGSEDPDKEAATRQWFAPVVREADLATLLREIDPRLVVGAIEWQPLAKGAGRRMRRKAIGWSLLAAIPMLRLLGWWGLLPACLGLVWALVYVRLALPRTGYANTHGLVLDREGVLTQRVTMAFHSRIQAVGVYESPFDRRHGMATVHVDTAGGSKLLPAVRLPYLERERALELQAELIAAVSTPMPEGDTARQL